MATAFDPFRQAEAQFRAITQQRALGQLDEASFRNALNALRLQDAQGNWWIPQEGTGTWLKWDGSQWLPSSPYPAAMPAAQMPAAQMPAAQMPAAQMPAAQMPAAASAYPPAVAKGVMGPALLYLALILLVAGAILAAAFFGGGGAPEQGVLIGVGIMAAVIWVIVLLKLRENWEGEVIDIRIERRLVRDSDGDVRRETKRYATLRQPDGTLRKQQAGRKWRVGDYMRKVRGELRSRKLN